ncbi:MAG: SDR family oxidoreductase [bacterium]|nr:SDR family oxidoreductase [bacterium]
MKILILGGDGMLGRHFFNYFQAQHEVRVTLRQELTISNAGGLFDKNNAYDKTDVRDKKRLDEIFNDFNPQVVINAAGIVKQSEKIKDIALTLEVNAVFPHHLAILCKMVGARLIHLSTDCVFSGKKGNYIESDQPDAEDLYGRSKFLGEVSGEECLTLRKSVIGRELFGKLGLLEWFLNQKDKVKGFTKAIYSGFTTREISRIIERIVTDYPTASGLYHVSSDPISKYDLLALIKKYFGLTVEVLQDENFVCDRSLNSDKFRKEFNYHPPTWEEMIKELAEEYKKL